MKIMPDVPFITDLHAHLSDAEVRLNIAHGSGHVVQSCMVQSCMVQSCMVQREKLHSVP